MEERKAILCGMAFWSKLAVTDSVVNRIISRGKAEIELKVDATVLKITAGRVNTRQMLRLHVIIY